MRQRDKPGTFRILKRGDRVLLTGLRTSGERIKIPGLTQPEAQQMAEKLFPSFATKPSLTSVNDDLDAWLNDDPNWQPSERLRASQTGAADLGAAMGMNPPTPPVIEMPKLPTAEETEKKLRRAKNAKSLMELVGVGWAGGTVWLGRKTCERFDKEPPMPNTRQVNDLADCTRDTLTDYFGDREIQPWMMMLLLTIGIPVSMMFQAKPRKSLPAQQNDRDLKSVP